MTPIHVVGIGLDGAAGLTEAVRHIVESAAVLVGSDRHLSYFPHHPAQRIGLGPIGQAIKAIQAHLTLMEPSSEQPIPPVAVLTSGDPLFFGLGRLLLEALPPEVFTFHPHPSAMQLAFSRAKLPWQDARLISAHGRSPDALIQALQLGADKIAVLTDGVNTPGAIARLLLSLDLPSRYRLWVCENLGGPTERVQTWWPEDMGETSFAPLNVVILQRVTTAAPLDLATLPQLGLPDSSFLTFADRPGLMTKREVRLLALGELALRPQITIWDIGAGTGSVSVEMARICPSAHIYAVEQTAAGISLIQQNCQRFAVETITAIAGAAPEALTPLPDPDRIFVGGSGGQLTAILDTCRARLLPGGVLVLAVATLEHLCTVQTWLQTQAAAGQPWHHRLLQMQIARSAPVGPLTRLVPLNPVMLLTLTQAPQNSPGSS